MATVLVSYAAGPRVYAANQVALVASAQRIGGFDRIESRGPLPADHPARRAQAETFAAAEGAGYWLWKPVIIGEALARSQPGDVVVYVDAGARFRRPLAPLLALAARRDAVLIANDHRNAAYTKRDAFVLTGTDVPACHRSRQLDAAFMLWRHTPRTLALVAAWLELCRDSRALTDAPSACGRPELPEFRAHRHDQAVLSLLLWREAPTLDVAVLPRRAKYVYLQHHRRRVAWLPIALWHATHDGPWELWRGLRRRAQHALRRARHRPRAR